MLTPKQEKFVGGLIQGLSQRQAYKAAYKVKWKDSAIDSRASTLFKNEKVKQRYNELLEELNNKTATKSIMTATERMEWLTEVVYEKQLEKVDYETRTGKKRTKSIPADLNTKMKAIDTLNKMTGEYKTVLSGNLNIEPKLEDLI